MPFDFLSSLLGLSRLDPRDVLQRQAAAGIITVIVLVAIAGIYYYFSDREDA